MSQRIEIRETGQADVMRLVDVAIATPGPGEVWLEQEAIGINFLDVTQRNGAVKIPLPSGLGLEGAGRVAAVGEGVDLEIGTRVGYALGPIGAYATGRIVPADRLVPLPQGLSSKVAATVTFKGITAHYLLKSTYPVSPGTVILAYGVAGALGQFLVPWARHLGARVIGVVSKPESVERARSRGCDEVLVWGSDDLPKRVAEITEGKMADVVYDGIGRATFDTSLACLRQRGTMVSIGASSGAPDPVAVGTLNAKGSLFLTRPGLAHHATDIAEYRSRVEDVYAAVASGVLPSDVWKEFALADAPKAHAALEGGVSQGPIILVP